MVMEPESEAGEGELERLFLSCEGEPADEVGLSSLESSNSSAVLPFCVGLPIPGVSVSIVMKRISKECKNKSASRHLLQFPLSV